MKKEKRKEKRLQKKEVGNYKKRSMLHVLEQTKDNLNDQAKLAKKREIDYLHELAIAITSGIYDHLIDPIPRERNQAIYQEDTALITNHLKGSSMNVTDMLEKVVNHNQKALERLKNDYQYKLQYIRIDKFNLAKARPKKLKMKRSGYIVAFFNQFEKERKFIEGKNFSKVFAAATQENLFLLEQFFKVLNSNVFNQKLDLTISDYLNYCQKNCNGKIDLMYLSEKIGGKDIELIVFKRKGKQSYRVRWKVKPN